MKQIHLYWSRRDFRLNDNPALYNATKLARTKDNAFLPIFVLEDYMLEANPEYQFGYPSRLFLSHAVPTFSSKFDQFLLLKGKGTKAITHIVKVLTDEYKCEVVVHVNDDVYVDFYKQISKLEKNNINVIVYNDQLTVNKNTLSGNGNLYSVFTPFKKAVWSEFLKSKVLSEATTKNLNYIDVNKIKLNENNKIKNINQKNIWEIFSKNRMMLAGKNIIDINELLTIDENEYDSNLINIINEEDAIKHIIHYIRTGKLSKYNINRDSLSLDAKSNNGETSRMSLPLAWGLISSRYIKMLIQDHYDDDFTRVNFMDKDTYGGHDAGAVQYISELIWREFYKYLLFNNPELMHTEFQEKFRNNIKWEKSDVAIKRFTCWIKGETGYPVVDAAMMQLARTGWMHNRSRMIVASILTKNLGVDWRWGQEYFRAMLIDLDEASNNGGWQWGASVGADPKPIRIFNPTLQEENYDKDHAYTSKWLSDEYKNSIMTPIVEHKLARNLALERYGLDSRSAARDY